MTGPNPRIAHVDHSVEPGGAELGLLRLLQAPHPWRATVIVAPGDAPPSDEAPGDEAPGGAAPRDAARDRSASSAAGVFVPLARAGDAAVVVSGPRQRPGASGAMSIIHTPRFAAAIARSAAALAREPAHRRADLVHANSTRAAVVAALARVLQPRRQHAPLVVHLRDRVDEASLGRAGFVALSTIVLPRCAGVIANSASTLAHAERLLPSSTPRAAIPSAAGIASTRVEHSTARVAERARRPVQRIGMVARLVPWKGGELLVRAFAAACAGRSITLEFVGGAVMGDPGFGDELARLATGLGVGPQTVFHGHLDDVAAAIDDLDVCVQCSTRPEPLGQNVLQYLAAGKPIVAAREGGPADLVEHGVTGLLTAPRRVEELAAALLRLIDDPGLRARLAMCAAMSSAVSTDAEIAARHGAFFQHVLESWEHRSCSTRRIGAGARR